VAPKVLSCVGLMFNAQKVSDVPREPHDQALRSVITEDGLIALGNSRSS
jgi:5-formyltetrahydrofolate cyclo-ligase